MKKIKTGLIVVAGATLLFTGGSAVGFASSMWAGHENMVQIQLNLDKLANQLSKNKDDLTNAQQALQQATNSQTDLQNQLAQAKTEYQNLQNQRTSDQTSFNKQLDDKQGEIKQKINEIQQKVKEIQQKVKEGNDRVAEKQKEVDALNKQLASQKQSGDADMAQAVKDAQDTRDKSDHIVNQYVGK